jgi:hypothetical protein
MLKSSELPLLLVLVMVVTVATVKLMGTPAPQPPPLTQASMPAFQQQPIVVVSSPRGADDRYSRAPRPQRFWDNGPEIPARGALDPIPTRGEPEAYQQMGVLTTPDNKVLPLYGRRVAPRSDYFNYYTRTDTYNPVALPVSFKQKDCQDNAGCSEIFSGDSLRLEPTGEAVKATLYGFDGPRYVPSLA